MIAYAEYLLLRFGPQTARSVVLPFLWSTCSIIVADGWNGKGRSLDWGHRPSSVPTYCKIALLHSGQYPSCVGTGKSFFPAVIFLGFAAPNPTAVETNLVHDAIIRPRIDIPVVSTGQDGMELATVAVTALPIHRSGRQVLAVGDLPDSRLTATETTRWVASASHCGPALSAMRHGVAITHFLSAGPRAASTCPRKSRRVAEPGRVPSGSASA